ncbi:MAG: hypothetical protein WBD58_01580 [Geitlerinemataceae cyanobacterium]
MRFSRGKCDRLRHGEEALPECILTAQARLLYNSSGLRVSPAGMRWRSTDKAKSGEQN